MTLPLISLYRLVYAMLLIYRSDVPPLVAHVAVEEYADTFLKWLGYITALSPWPAATNDSDSSDDNDDDTIVNYVTYVITFCWQ